MITASDQRWWERSAIGCGRASCSEQNDLRTVSSVSFQTRLEARCIGLEGEVTLKKILEVWEKEIGEAGEGCTYRFRITIHYTWKSLKC